MTSAKSLLSTLAGFLGKLSAREGRTDPVRSSRADARLRPEGVRGRVGDVRADDSSAGRMPGCT